MVELTASRVYLRDTTEFNRAIAFVDAIFGFSATLLVTTLQMPPAEAWTDLGALLRSGLGQQLMAFAISFAVIVGFWRTNHRVVSGMRGLDAVTLRMCFYLVALIAFIPFTTKAISEPNPEDLPLPTALYAAHVALAVLVSVGLVIAARVRGLSDDTRPLGPQIVGGLIVAGIFLASIPVAYRFGPGPAKYLWLALLVDQFVKYLKIAPRPKD